MTSGTAVLASQYVTIQDKAQSLLGSGTVTRGYGQAVQSADVFIGNNISKAQWDLLRFDIINIKLHQDGNIPPVVQVAVGDVIGFGPSAPNTNYNIILEDAIAKRFQVAGSQSVVTAKANTTYSSAWSTQAEAVLTCTFATADQGRYFFNSGGKIRVNTALTSGVNTQQINSWVNFLASVGTQSFGADSNPVVNYYTLTNVYQTFFQSAASSSYSFNSYTLAARVNVSNNNTGTATVLEIRVTLADAYTDPDVISGTPTPFPPGDSVSGTLTMAITELKAAGQLQPSGTFAITSPAYSLSAITAS